MRTALITGAAGGMGTAISSALIEQGYQVVLVDRDQAAVTALAQSLGDKATGWVLDITNGAMVDQLPQCLPEGFREIDVLVNNAGHDIGGVSASTWARRTTGLTSFKPI